MAQIPFGNAEGLVPEGPTREAAVSNALRDHRVSDGAFALLAHLYELHREPAGCSVSPEVLARELHVSASAVNRCLSDLERLGYVSTSTEDSAPGSPAMVRVNPQLRRDPRPGTGVGSGA